MEPTNITPTLDPQPRVTREITFDMATFDILMDFKRKYSAVWRRSVTNSETIRALLRSHPAAPISEER